MEILIVLLSLSEIDQPKRLKRINKKTLSYKMVSNAAIKFALELDNLEFVALMRHLRRLSFRTFLDQTVGW